MFFCIAVAVENFVDSHEGERPSGPSKQGLRLVPVVTLGQPGEQAGAEVGGQDDRPGAVAVDGDENLALGHGDAHGSKGDDLDGGQASSDEGDEGSVAQSDGSA